MVRRELGEEKNESFLNFKFRPIISFGIAATETMKNNFKDKVFNENKVMVYN